MPIPDTSSSLEASCAAPGGGAPRGSGPLLRPWPVGRAERRLAAAALVVRAVFWLLLAAEPQRAYVGGDGRDYMGLAANLLAEGRLTLHSALPLQADYSRPPLYPGFLACIRAVSGPIHLAPEIAVGAVQCALSVWTCLLAYRLARRIWPAARTGCALAAAWLALDPSVAVFGCLVMTETLFMVLWIAAAACLDEAFGRGERGTRLAHWLAACLLLALAALTRPIGQAAIAVAGACWLASGLRVRGPAGRCPAGRLAAGLMAGLVVFSLPLLAWSLRNRAVGGPFALSDVGPFNFLLYTYQLDSPGATDEEIWRDAMAEAQAILDRHPGDVGGAHAEMAARGRARLLADPGMLLRGTAVGLAETAVSPAYELFPFLGLAPECTPPIAGSAALRAALRAAPAITSWRLGLMIWTASASALAAIALVRGWRRLACTTLAFVVLLALAHAALGALAGSGRFRVPIAPLIAVVAAGARGGAAPTGRRP